MRPSLEKVLIKKAPHKKNWGKKNIFLFFTHVSIWPPSPAHLVSKRQQSATPPTHRFADIILEWSLTTCTEVEFSNFLVNPTSVLVVKV